MARPASTIYIARQAFVCAIGDEVYHVKEGERVRSGHPLLDAQPGYFDPVDDKIHFDVPVEQATSAPGERRGVRRGDE